MGCSFHGGNLRSSITNHLYESSQQGIAWLQLHQKVGCCVPKKTLLYYLHQTINSPTSWHQVHSDPCPLQPNAENAVLQDAANPRGVVMIGAMPHVALHREGEWKHLCWKLESIRFLSQTAQVSVGKTYFFQNESGLKAVLWLLQVVACHQKPARGAATPHPPAL